jgi:opacity protein-like surface antigen
MTRRAVARTLNHKRRITMIRNMIAVTGTVLALAAAAPPALAQTDGPEGSSARGLSLGMYVSSASLFIVENRSTTYGSGIGLSVGYGVTDRFGLHASTSGAVLKPSASNIWLLGHADLEARWTFASEARRWAPHLAVGVGARTASFDVLDEEAEKDWRSDPGITLGGGASWFVAPGVSLDASLRHSFGNLGDMRCPQGGEVASTCATSTRLNLGASWYPRSTR